MVNIWLEENDWSPSTSENEVIKEILFHKYLKYSTLLLKNKIYFIIISNITIIKNDTQIFQISYITKRTYLYLVR